MTPFLNLLISYVQILKGVNYSFGSFIPESVQKRSQDYLQNCLEIHNLFINYFEPADNNVEFISVKTVITTFKRSDEYEALTKKQKRDLTEDCVKKFFSKNIAYRDNFKEQHNYYSDGLRKNAKSVLLGWRLKDNDNNEY